MTEVRYFEAFPVPKQVQVAVHGEGKNTTSLVAAAVKHADRAREDDVPFDEVWLVYDHDDFGADKFNRAAQEVDALDATRDELWQAAWSHQAFEVWYLLHFQYFDGQLHRHHVQKRLGDLLAKHCGRGYRKNDPYLYELLLSRQPTALQHALRLARTHGVTAPHRPPTPTLARRSIGSSRPSTPRSAEPSRDARAPPLSSATDPGCLTDAHR